LGDAAFQKKCLAEMRKVARERSRLFRCEDEGAVQCAEDIKEELYGDGEVMP